VQLASRFSIVSQFQASASSGEIERLRIDLKGRDQKLEVLRSTIEILNQNLKVARNFVFAQSLTLSLSSYRSQRTYIIMQNFCITQ
jgi:lipoate synthase